MEFLNSLCAYPDAARAQYTLTTGRDQTTDTVQIIYQLMKPEKEGPSLEIVTPIGLGQS